MDFEIYEDIAKNIAEDSRLRRFHKPETLGLGSGGMIYTIWERRSVRSLLLQICTKDLAFSILVM